MVVSHRTSAGAPINVLVFTNVFAIDNICCSFYNSYMTVFLSFGASDRSPVTSIKSHIT